MAVDINRLELLVPVNRHVDSRIERHVSRKGFFEA